MKAGGKWRVLGRGEGAMRNITVKWERQTAGLYSALQGQRKEGLRTKGPGKAPGGPAESGRQEFPVGQWIPRGEGKEGEKLSGEEGARSIKNLSVHNTKCQGL